MTTIQRAATGNRNYDQRPTRDRAVDSKTVACPTCAAAIGEPCTPQLHQVRRRLAIRLLHSDNALPCVDLPLPSRQKMQGVRRGAGLSRRELGLLIDVSDRTIYTFEHGISLPTGDARARIAAWYAEIAASGQRLGSTSPGRAAAT